MVIYLNNGSTDQSWCDGPSGRGSTGLMIGPVAHQGLDVAFALQTKQPLRALNTTPIQRNLARQSLGFSVYQIFASEAAAQMWAYYTWPTTCFRSGLMKIFFTYGTPVPGTTPEVDFTNVVLTHLKCVPVGVTVDVSFSFDADVQMQVHA